jgi:hypothetical protein
LGKKEKKMKKMKTTVETRPDKGRTKQVPRQARGRYGKGQD